LDWKNSKNFKKYKGTNILAIDYGTKRVGLATFCPGQDPFPLAYSTLENKNEKLLILEIKNVIDSEGINLVLVGRPYLLDGKATAMTQKTKKFAKSLSSTIKGISVMMQDETLSSFEAEDRMKNSPEFNFKIDKKKLDQVAATILIEDFLRDE